MYFYLNSLLYYLPCQNVQRQDVRFIEFIIFLFVFSFIGCTTQREALEIDQRTELPVYEGAVEDGSFNLRVLFQVMENGQVADVHMMTSSGDDEWDSAAIDSMKKWTFDSLPTDSDDIWLQKNIKVEFIPSKIMNIGVLRTGNEQVANMLYSRLRTGIRFEQLVQQNRDNSTGDITGEYIKEVNTAKYPIHASQILLDLSVGGYSKPVKIRGEYVIFKRFGDYLPDE